MSYIRLGDIVVPRDDSGSTGSTTNGGSNVSLDNTVNTLVGGLVAVKMVETMGNMFDKTTRSTRRKKKSRSKGSFSEGFGTGLNLL